MNQPNLSKAIKELEAMVGVTLFKRTTKGVSCVTEEGRVFIEYAKSILLQFEDMQLHFRPAEGKKRAFQIAIPRASYLAEAFTRFVAMLCGENAFNVSIYETNAMMAINSVVEDGYNLGVVRYRTKYEKYFLSFLSEKGLDYREILKADSVIIMSAKNPLASKAVLAPGDLHDMIEVANDDFTMPRHLSADKTPEVPACKKQIFVYERGSQFDLLSQIPQTYMWVSPMPRDVLERNALVQKSCDAQDIEFKDVLISRRGKRLGKLELDFLGCLQQVIASILVR